MLYMNFVRRIVHITRSIVRISGARFRLYTTVKGLRARRDAGLFDQLLRQVPAVDVAHSDTLRVFSNHGSHTGFYGKLYPLVAYELSRQGIPCCFLFKSQATGSHFPRLFVDSKEISNSLIVRNRIIRVADEASPGMLNDWELDYEGQKIETQGINFFPLIRTTLQASYKKYNIDFSDVSIRDNCQDLIATCDILVDYFLLLKKYARDTGKRIRIIGWEVNYIPNSVFKVLCGHFVEDRDVEFVDLARGYKHYFGYHFRDSFVSAANCTLLDVDSRMTITAADLRELEEDGSIHHEELISSIDGVISRQKESGAIDGRNEVVEKIEAYRRRGRNIFVLFAHLFYDTPIYDSSPAFEDMCCWIKETVQFFENREDLLLLKPHPVEIRPEFPEKAPNETLASLIEGKTMSNNIVLIHPQMFSLKELSKYMTCGLIWRSSAALELTYLRTPTIIAGNPVYNVLDLNYPRSREHYFQLIENVRELKVSSSQIEDVAKYLYILDNRKHYYIDAIGYDPGRNEYFWNKKALLECMAGTSQSLQQLTTIILT